MPLWKKKDGTAKMGDDSDSEEDEIQEGTIRLKIRGVDLPKRKNPFVVIFFHQGASDFSKRRSFVGDRGVTQNTAKWAELGRTEVYQNKRDVAFRRPFTVPYDADVLQELRIEFYSELTKTLDLTRQEFIGAAEVRLIDICDAKNGSLKLKLSNVITKTCGSVNVVVKCR